MTVLECSKCGQRYSTVDKEVHNCNYSPPKEPVSLDSVGNCSGCFALLVIISILPPIMACLLMPLFGWLPKLILSIL